MNVPSRRITYALRVVSSLFEGVRFLPSAALQCSVERYFVQSLPVRIVGSWLSNRPIEFVYALEMPFGQL